MTTTTSRPLPYTITQLREHWTPAEPTDTTVAAARAAQTTIWACVVDAQHELDRLEAGERGAVADLVALAITGDDIAKSATDLGRRSPVPALRHHVQLLHQAYSTASSRLNTAMLSDPAYLAWLAECREIEHDWQRAISDSEDRTAALLAFAEAHRPS